MQLTKDFYLQEADRIITFLKKDFVMSNGAFYLERCGKNIFAHHIFPDFGDFAPFFLYFGQEDFVDGQVSIFRKTLKNNILISEFPSFGIKNLAKSYEYTDLLLGLIDYHFFKKDKENYKLLFDSVNTAVDIFGFDKKPRSFYSPKLKLSLPILDTRDATFIEIFADLYKSTSDKKYLDIAYNIYNKLIAGKFFRKYGLFPTWDANFAIRSFFNLINDKFNSALIHKNTSNGLFGLLALYKETRDKNILDNIFFIISSLKDRATLERGGIIETYRPGSIAKEASLSSSFSVLDFLCDLHFLIKRKEDLDYAENIAKYWINRQGRTGLFSEFSGGKSSFFDAETDMCVALYKLSELTGNGRYSEAADKCLSGIIEFHGKKDYVLSVNINNGEVINRAQRTKFIALFLKLLILKIETIGGKSIYGNKKLLDLIKDR